MANEVRALDVLLWLALGIAIGVVAIKLYVAIAVVLAPTAADCREESYEDQQECWSRYHEAEAVRRQR